MTERRLKWGILGVSRIGNKLIPAIQKAASSEAYAIASRDLKRSREAADKFKIAKAHRSYEDLIGDSEIDVIYIPLPNALHFEWMVKAVKNGKHILCEKPLCVTREQTQKAILAAKENQVKWMEGYMWPHHPRTQALRKIVDSGRLGKVRHVNTALNFLLTDEYSLSRRTPELGGGSLYDVGCYCISGIRWAFQEEPLSVFSSAVYKNGIDTEMSALLEFSDGKSALFHSSFNHAYRGTLEVVGTEAILRVPQMWNPFSNSDAEIWEKGELKETLKFETADQVTTMIENFNRHILFDEALPLGSQDSLENLAVIDALYKSSQVNGKIKIEKLG